MLTETTQHLQKQTVIHLLLGAILFCFPGQPPMAQTPPSTAEIASYTGLHHFAHTGNLARVQQLVAAGANLETTDKSGRTALHIAAHASHPAVITRVAKAGANMNALDDQAYDIVTIAAVANDLKTLDASLSGGASPSNITSPYQGTALIAAAHLGHYTVVNRLIEAGAPLDHVNNLGWTALIEAVILGHGGPDHVRTVQHLVNAGANKNIPDGEGHTPLDLARARGYPKIVSILKE